MVDIVMAVYNGEHYLEEQIDSILNQSYREMRVLIRDDGSSDHTIEIIKDYERRYPDRVKLIWDDVQCGSSCRNFMQALKYTTADYVMFSDQDDVWLPDKIQHSLDQMLEIEKRIGKDKPILVFGSYQPVNEKLEKIRDDANARQEAAYKLAFANLLVQNYVNGCLMMVNRTLADRMGDYDENMLMHDWWAALIAAGGGEIRHIDEVMLLYRQHEGNVVGSVNVKSFRYRMHKLLDPETKYAAQLYRKQAVLLFERNRQDLTDPHRAELRNFIDLYQKNKFGRMWALIRGGYLKSDLVRVIGQLFYI